MLFKCFKQILVIFEVLHQFIISIGKYICKTFSYNNIAYCKQGLKNPNWSVSQRKRSNLSPRNSDKMAKYDNENTSILEKLLLSNDSDPEVNEIQILNPAGGVFLNDNLKNAIMSMEVGNAVSKKYGFEFWKHIYGTLGTFIWRLSHTPYTSEFFYWNY